MGFYRKPLRRITERRIFRRRLRESFPDKEWDVKDPGEILDTIADEVPVMFPDFDCVKNNGDEVRFEVRAHGFKTFLYVFKWNRAKGGIKIGTKKKSGSIVPANIADCFSYEDIKDACKEIIDQTNSRIS